MNTKDIKEQKELIALEKAMGKSISKSEVKKILNQFLASYQKEDVKIISRAFTGSGHAIDKMLTSFVDDVISALDGPL